MQKSKYSDAERRQVLEMYAEKGMTLKNIADKLGIPIATVSRWINKAKKKDPEFEDKRRRKKGKIVDRAMKIVDASVTAIEQQVRAAAADRRKIDQLLEQVKDDPCLDDKVRNKICKIVEDYAGMSIRDLTHVAKEAGALERQFAADLEDDKDASQEVKIQFADSDLENAAQ